MRESMPSPEEVNAYLGKMKKRGERTLSLLGQNQGFISAIETDIGKELLSDLIRDHELLLTKISELNASDEDKMLYRVVRRLLVAWGDRITAYNDKIKEIKKG